MPKLREALSGVPAYRAGRPAAPREDGSPAYKVSSNENPYPPLPGVLEAVAQAATELNRYPDPNATRLVAALAERLGVETDELSVGPGSVGVFQQILASVAGEGDEVVYAWRSFEAYPIMVQLAGAVSVQVPLTADHRHDLDAMLKAITERTRLVIVCTPNNPTGPSVGLAELDDFLDAVPRDVLVLIDEAYREFGGAMDPAADPAKRYRDRSNVVVLRTFSKAYGLAGLRVGYAVTRPRIAEALRKTALPFGVSGVAQAAAVASLAAEPALLERVSALVAERERVLSALWGQGWPVPDTEANFVWFPLGAATEAFAVECEAAGLVVRAFPGDGVRVTIAEPEANDRLIALGANARDRHL
ncbi:histidinol-phosphate transaminase [Spongisporangium articulatum]|uniref:Aromatic amino acid aminotransferase n=1 Tax=Spongisporangium articulatum TaxID=3362603 RepID=A0ABW8AHU2_9ACTN